MLFRSAAAYVLRHRQLIVIEVLTLRLNKRLQRLAQAAALVIIILFCAVAVYYGTQSMVESITLKRASSTMLTVPLWMTEVAIPLGFGTLMFQALAELGALWQRRPAQPR